MNETGISGLATALWMEDRPIEDHASSLLLILNAKHCPFVMEEIGVAKVDWISGEASHRLR